MNTRTATIDHVAELELPPAAKLPATNGHRGEIESVPETGILGIIERASRDPEINVDKLERLLGLAREQRAEDAQQAFNGAMNKAQGDMKPIAADAANPQTKSKYASYLALDRAMRPIYTRHGFSLSFDTGEGGPADHVRVVCHVGHSAGHNRTYHVDMPTDGKGAKGNDVMTKTHATGAGLSYGQRYLLKLIFNIAVGEDLDGNDPADNDGLINDDQIQKVFDIINRAKADTKKVCTFLNVESVPDIRVRDFEKCIKALNEYERSKLR